MCALAKVDALSFWKSTAKGARCGQNQCNYAFRRLPRASWLVSATHTTAN
jgi:hypothetical protein